MQLQCPLSTEGFQPRGCQNALNKSPGIVLSLPEVWSQLGRAGRWREAAHPPPEENGLGRDSEQPGLLQESAPWIKSALLAGVACAHKPLCTLVFVLLARSWAGKCVTASTKAFGDFLKKSFMELQILKRPFYMRALCAAPFCVPLPPRPDDRVPFKLL